MQLQLGSYVYDFEVYASSVEALSEEGEGGGYLFGMGRYESGAAKSSWKREEC